MTRRPPLLPLAIPLTASLAILMVASTAEGQRAAPAVTTTATQTPVVVPDPNEGAFDELSPGSRKIARALFEAQQARTKPLSLNDIAALRQRGQGWGAIFIDMKAQGLFEPDEPTIGTEGDRDRDIGSRSNAGVSKTARGSRRTR